MKREEREGEERRGREDRRGGCSGGRARGAESRRKVGGDGREQKQLLTD